MVKGEVLHNKNGNIYNPQNVIKIKSKLSKKIRRKLLMYVDCT